MALTHARPSSRNADVTLQLALQAHSSHPQSCARLLFFDFPVDDGTWRKARFGHRDGFFPELIAFQQGRRFGFCRHVCASPCGVRVHSAIRCPKRLSARCLCACPARHEPEDAVAVGLQLLLECLAVLHVALREEDEHGRAASHPSRSRCTASCGRPRSTPSPAARGTSTRWPTARAPRPRNTRRRALRRSGRTRRGRRSRPSTAGLSSGLRCTRTGVA